MLPLPEFLSSLVMKSVEAALLVLLILGVKLALGRWLSPRAHYALWFLLFAKLLLPAGPSSPLSLANYLPGATQAKVEANAGRVFHGWITTPEPAPVSTTKVSAAPAVSAPQGESGGSMLFGIWLAGVVACLSILALNSVRFGRIVRRASTVRDEVILSQLKQCCADAGVHRTPRLLESDEVTTPLLAGLLRPCILVPKSMLADAEALRFVFLHELVHLRRGDLLTSWMAAGLQAVHWFNPVLWFAFSRMRLDREISCDARVVAIIGAELAPDYGRTLVNLAEHVAAWRSPSTAIGVTAPKSQMKRRIHMIAQLTQATRRNSAVAFAVIAVITAVSFTSAQPPADAALEQAKQQPEEAKSLGQKLSEGFDRMPSPGALLMQTPLGKKPFTLTVDAEKGELNYIFGPDKELERIEAKRGVTMKTEDLAIRADSLVYDTTSATITANGPDLEVSIGERTKVSSNKFERDLRTDRLAFSGNARFVATSLDGSTRETRGDTITIDNSTSSPQIRVKASKGLIPSRP